MKKFPYRTFLILVCAVPYVFLGMYGDAALHTMALYLPMLAGLSLLCFLSVRARSVQLLLAGNALSFASSCVFAVLCGLECWPWYFKPFSPVGFLTAVSAAALAIQAAVLMVCSQHYKKRVNA